MTVPQRLQLYRVLDAFGVDYLQESRKLRTLLCPIVARSEREQEQFYELFDLFIRVEGAEVQAPPRKPWWQKVPEAVWWILLAGITFLGAYLLWRSQQEPEPIGVGFRHPPRIALGDPVYFENISSGLDTNRTRFDWELRDAESDVREANISDSRHWSLRIPEQGNSYRKWIWLRAYDRNSGELLGEPFSSTLTLLCPDFPEVGEPVFSPATGSGFSGRFSLAGEPEDGLTYLWDFGDGQAADVFSPEHTYDRPGVYTVTLRVERPGQPGQCYVERSLQVAVGPEKAFLEHQAVQRDHLDRLLQFGLGTWILWGLVALFVIYYWVKWGAWKPPQPKTLPPEKRFAFPDKGPYTIPFRSNAGSVTAGAALYRLADLLRQRQEGQRQYLDVPQTIRHTIRSGGFPRVRFRRSSEPPAYLILAEHHPEGPHPDRLLDFLLDFLREKDVHFAVFRYRGQLDRLRNPHHPEGLNLEQLYRLYPGYRLLIFGRGHEWLDPHASGKPALRRFYAENLMRWRERAFLSPQPVASWNYRERALYEVAPVFPLQVEGIRTAVTHLERQAEEETTFLPVFPSWKETLQPLDPQPDINYLDWQAADTYRKLFADDPALYRWLCALCVSPHLNWDLTLAIGRALSGQGVIVDFDHLARLAQIPWLQGADLPTRLRDALLGDLDRESETLARQAVVAELQAVAPHLEGSSANFDVQKGLALQSFALNPGDPTAREELRYLRTQGLLGRREVKSLEQTISRHLEQKGTSSDLSLDAFLNEDPSKPAKPRRPLNRYFWLALGSTALYLLMGLTIYLLDGTDRLYKLAFNEDPQELPDTIEPRNRFFIRENLLLDSAVIYNNMGVDVWDQRPLIEGRFNRREAEEAVNFFRRASDWAVYYPLADSNRYRGYFNLALEHYHQYLDAPGDQALLTTALEAFREAYGSPEIELQEASLHGQGLVHYYLHIEDPDYGLDSARNYYEQLLAAGYWSVFRPRPNLETLLRKAGDAPCTAPPFEFALAEGIRPVAGKYCGAGPIRLRAASPDGAPFRYYRIFWGDGARDSLPDLNAATHLYELPGAGEGAFTIAVDAFYDCPDGASTYTSFELPVVLVSNASLAVDYPAQACAGEPVEFRFTGVGDEIEWTFETDAPARSLESIRNSGPSLSEDEPTGKRGRIVQQIFPEPGRYTFTVVASNACGVAVNETYEIRIEDCVAPGAPQVLTGNEDALVQENQNTVSRTTIFTDQGGENYNLTGNLIRGLQTDYTATTLEQLRSQLLNGIFLNVESFAPEGCALYGDAFFDATDGGCWTCPDGFRRTTSPVTSAQACMKAGKPATYSSATRLGPNNANGQMLFQPSTRVESRHYAVIFFHDVTKSTFAQNSPGSLQRDQVGELAATLRRYGFEIQVVTDPTEKEIQNQLSQIRRLYGTGSVDRGQLLMLFIGPGVLDPRKNLIGFVTPDEQLLYFREVQEAVNDLTARHILLLWDLHNPFSDRQEIQDANDPVPVPEMVPIKGGTFQMGDVFGEGDPDELPVHEVTVSDFQMGAYEVTFEEYDAFCEATGREKPDDYGWGRGRRPVMRVSWLDAVAYCNWLSDELGYQPVYRISGEQVTINPKANGYRLPTEAEWEYAAREGGRKVRFGNGKDIADPEEINFDGSAGVDYGYNVRGLNRNQTVAVGSFAPNRLGLYDMSGNVWEWCGDWYDGDYYAQTEGALDPVGPDKGSYRVNRGGSWIYHPWNCRAAYRNDVNPTFRSNSIGFRLALSAQ